MCLAKGFRETLRHSTLPTVYSVKGMLQSPVYNFLNKMFLFPKNIFHRYIQCPKGKPIGVPFKNKGGHLFLFSFLASVLLMAAPPWQTTRRETKSILVFASSVFVSPSVPSSLFLRRSFRRMGRRAANDWSRRMRAVHKLWADNFTCFASSCCWPSSWTCYRVRMRRRKEKRK